MDIRLISTPGLRAVHSKRWRAWGLALAGIVVLAPFSRAREDAKPEVAPTPNPSLEADAVVAPSPKFTPEDVVQKQMQTLSAAGPVAARIERCYRFASPANRDH